MAAQNQAEHDQLEKASAMRRYVGRLVADGQCKNAMRAALESGDFGLAREVQGICGTTDPTPSP